MPPSKYFTIPHWPGVKAARVQSFQQYMPTRRYADLALGKKMAEGLLAGKVVALHPEAGDQLTDFLGNSNRLLLASERARAFLQSQGFGPGELEFIPFRIQDKKGKPLPNLYSIANPLVHVRCLDVEKSKCVALGEDGPPEYRVSALHIDARKVPPDARLFHLAESPSRLLIRDDLLAEIRKAKLTGLVEQELGKPI